MPNMTKTAFLAAYEENLKATYGWAQDPDNLARFMSVCADTLANRADRAKSWNHDGSCVRNAWREIGGKGKPTLKGLRELPND